MLLLYSNRGEVRCDSAKAGSNGTIFSIMMSIMRPGLHTLRALPLALLLALPVFSQSPTQSPPQTPTTLRGGGLEVTGDFTGWQQQSGAGILHGNYYRLGLFYQEKGPALSLLIDDIPKDSVDLESLCNGSAKSWKSVSGLKILEPRTFAGKDACLYTFVGAGSRRNLYVEMLVNQRWLEFHYSKQDDRDALASGRAAMEKIIGSLQIAPYQSKPGEMLMADITNEEVFMAEAFLNCDAKSTDLFCRGLAAFKGGRRPLAPPEVFSLAGVSILGPFERVVEPQSGPSYLTVAKSGVRYGPIDLKGKESKAADELVRLLRGGKPVPETNVAQVFARSQKQTDPVLLAERSLIVTPDLKAYLRETDEGYVLYALVLDGQGFLLAVFPVAH